MFAGLRRGYRASDQGQQLSIVVVHQRRDMSETVVNHVWLGRELRMRSVTNELCHGETAPADVLIESAIRERSLSGHKVDVRLVPDTRAQRPQLRDFALVDRELALCPEVDLAGVPDVKLVQLRADLAPDTGLFVCVVDERGDRKSTRLNSSHLGISYAVFCL